MSKIRQQINASSVNCTSPEVRILSCDVIHICSYDVKSCLLEIVHYKKKFVMILSIHGQFT